MAVKEKPIIITTWAIRERFGTRDVNQESADQASQSGTRSESLLSYKALIINYKDCFRWWSRW